MKIIMKTPAKHGGKWLAPGAAIALDDKEAAALVARGLCTYAMETSESDPKRGRSKKDGE